MLNLIEKPINKKKIKWKQIKYQDFQSQKKL